jgi:hypothetical protein
MPDLKRPFKSDGGGSGARKQLETPHQRERLWPSSLLSRAVADVARWKSFDAERTTAFAPFATDVTSYTDPNGGKTVALTANVHDVAGMQAFMQMTAAAESMEKHGVLQPVAFMTA